MAAPRVRIARIYEEPGPAAPGERRVLVDRLWPRGLKRDVVKVDAWMPELGPSNELRRWFGHDPKRWTEFQRRYRAELADADRTAQLRALRQQARREPLLLLYGAKDRDHNQAMVLRDVLTGSGPRAASASSARARRPAGSRSRAGA